MGLFRRGKDSKQNDDLIPMEQLFNPSRTEKKSLGAKGNLCLKCEKYNSICPYGSNTQCIGCSDFVAKGSGAGDSGRGLRCPRCGSGNTIGTYSNRRQCRNCGNIFS